VLFSITYARERGSDIEADEAPNAAEEPTVSCFLELRPAPKHVPCQMHQRKERRLGLTVRSRETTQMPSVPRFGLTTGEILWPSREGGGWGRAYLSMMVARNCIASGKSPADCAGVSISPFLGFYPVVRLSLTSGQFESAYSPP